MSQQSRNIVLTISIIVAVLVVSGVVAWRYISTHQLGSVSQTPGTGTPKTGEYMEPADYAGERLVSGKNAFSIYVPGGWTGINASDTDYFRFSGITYDSNKMSASVESTNAYGKDGFSTQVAALAEKTTTERTYDDTYTKSDFQTTAGLKGTKYFKEYTAGEALGITNAQGGEREYSYVFENDGTRYVISYLLEKGMTDDHEYIEKFVRTLRVD